MRVRCPSCKTVEVDPPVEFVCGSCGTRLAWRPKSRLLFPEQLWLFTPEGTAQSLQLDLEPETPAPGPSSRQPSDETSAPPRASSAHPLTHAVALITAMLPADEADPELITAVLVDRVLEDSMGLAMGVAQVCAAFIRHLDEIADGAGTAWLRQLANLVAAAELEG